MTPTIERRRSSLDRSASSVRLASVMSWTTPTRRTWRAVAVADHLGALADPALDAVGADDAVLDGVGGASARRRGRVAIRTSWRSSGWTARRRRRRRWACRAACRRCGRSPATTTACGRRPRSLRQAPMCPTSSALPSSSWLSRRRSSASSGCMASPAGRPGFVGPQRHVGERSIPINRRRSGRLECAAWDDRKMGGFRTIETGAGGDAVWRLDLNPTGRVLSTRTRGKGAGSWSRLRVGRNDARPPVGHPPASGRGSAW